jgi:drug/metabolite transporter (DMT)-like permease
MTNNNTKALLSASFAVLSWSTVATAFKLALRVLTHYQLLLVAATTATLIFAVVITLQHKWHLLKQLSLPRWTFFILLGLLNPVIYYLVLFRSYALLPAQVAQPINYMWPIFLTIMLALVGHRRIPAMKYAGLLVSLGGVACISLGSFSISGAHISLGGLLLGALSALLWATYWMISDRNKWDSTVSLFLCFFFGTIYLFAFAPLAGADSLPASGIPAGIYVGCFEMALPFLAFGYALRNTSNTVLVNQMCYLAPFMSLFFIAVVLGEHIVLTTYMGLALIVAGILFNQYVVKEAKAKR